jgi:acetyl-CoA carboxylase carboxyl transferase subunit beta
MWLIGRASDMQIKLPFSRRRDVTPETWTVCPSCESQIFNRQLERNLRVCPTCGHHFRMGIGQRIELLLDEGSFVEHDAGLESGDPLSFHDQKPYVDSLKAAQVKTGLREAAVWGIGTIDGHRIAIGLFDFHFMGGSMGSVVGEKLARCFEAALVERIPAVVVSASGGARMQEGTLSLLQLAKTTAPLTRLDAAGIPFISILTDPTTGGVLASFASLGDVILAEPKALIGFAGARVASGTVGEELPEGFQSAESLLEHGFVDDIVPRSELRATLSRLLRLIPVAPVEDGLGTAGETRGWGPIGMLSGMAERLGTAVSETIGIEVERQPAEDPGTAQRLAEDER